MTLWQALHERFVPPGGHAESHQFGRAAVRFTPLPALQNCNICHMYLSSAWNKLDGFIVTVSVIDTILTYATAGGGANLSMLRILRIFRIFRYVFGGLQFMVYGLWFTVYGLWFQSHPILRALRPLRIVSRAKGVRIVITTLLSATGPMMNTMSIAIGVFAIFGILAVQLFGGNSHFCRLNSQTPNPKPQTPNPKPQTPNPQPSTTTPDILQRHFGFQQAGLPRRKPCRRHHKAVAERRKKLRQHRHRSVHNVHARCW